jgi:hypothetical protein
MSSTSSPVSATSPARPPPLPSPSTDPTTTSSQPHQVAARQISSKRPAPKTTTPPPRTPARDGPSLKRAKTPAGTPARSTAVAERGIPRVLKYRDGPSEAKAGSLTFLLGNKEQQATSRYLEKEIHAFDALAYPTWTVSASAALLDSLLAPYFDELLFLGYNR